MLEQLTHKDWCRFIGSIIKQYVSVCSRNGLIDADDLEQEAWGALLLAARNYEADKSDAKFTSYAWIYINFSVRELVFPKSDLKHKTISETDMSSGMPDIEDQFDDFVLFENDDTFRLAIAELSSEDFELVDQHFVQGLTFVEMAAMNDVTPQAMQQRLRRVISKLKRHFNIEDPNGN
jgi:RNA polymerase sigma factor (sigma-70 family)